MNAFERKPGGQHNARHNTDRTTTETKGQTEFSEEYIINKDKSEGRRQSLSVGATDYADLCDDDDVKTQSAHSRSRSRSTDTGTPTLYGAGHDRTILPETQQGHLSN
jgi:hypothetical protein